MDNKFVEPSLRACTSCLTENTKCVKAITLVFSMDLESHNRAAQVMIDERKKEHSVNAHIDLCERLPDPVHVGKRISRQFSNWYLIVNGYRINRVQLRTLRNDPFVSKHLMAHLSVAACHNRDRMDVESMLEISSQQVRNAISSNVETITDTIIPEKFRVYEGNKKGLLDSPTVVYMGPFGTVYVCDAAKGNSSARLHYPVDMNEIYGSLYRPVDIAYTEGSVFIAEYRAARLSCVDLDYNMVYIHVKLRWHSYGEHQQC